jgi:predicted phosphodiesterase
MLSFLFFSCAACSQSNAPSRENNPADFSLVAIGDAGERNDILDDNAKTMTEIFRRNRFDALIFLGDNFYPSGLNFNANKDPRREVPSKIKKALGPFREVMRGLGRQNVHAVAGNHDYYKELVVDKSFLFGIFSIEALPVGIANKGNQRADTISSWTYHYDLPEQALFQIDGQSKDSLQIIFFDSAILLRTKPPTWRPYLARLHSLLVATQNRPQIKWRLLALHHPLYSVGDHGGYSEWDPETRTVGYVNRCDPDSDAVSYLTNLVDPEDLCAERYRAYRDSVLTTIQSSGVLVQLTLSGHDHSLQFLYYPNANPASPKIYVVSGAGAKENPVKAPSPQDGEFTCPDNTPQQQGKSRSGFARLDFYKTHLRVRFFNGKDKKEIDMGGGRREFMIKPDGKLAAN